MPALKIGRVNVRRLGPDMYELMQEGHKYADYPGESPGNRYVGPLTAQELKVLGHYLLFVAEGGDEALST